MGILAEISRKRLFTLRTSITQVVPFRVDSLLPNPVMEMMDIVPQKYFFCTDIGGGPKKTYTQLNEIL